MGVSSQESEEGSDSDGLGADLDGDGDVELRLARLEHLLERRPILVRAGAEDSGAHFVEPKHEQRNHENRGAEGKVLLFVFGELWDWGRGGRLLSVVTACG